jgi:hypothetical protein
VCVCLFAVHAYSHMLARGKLRHRHKHRHRQETREREGEGEREREVREREFIRNDTPERGVQGVNRYEWICLCRTIFVGRVRVRVCVCV